MGRNEILMAGGLTAAALLSGCATTMGPRSTATPEGSCLPGVSTFELGADGDSFDAAVRDLSIEGAIDGREVQDTLHIAAIGNSATNDVEVVRLTVSDGHSLSVSPLSEDLPFSQTIVGGEDIYDFKVDEIRSSESRKSEAELGEGDVRTTIKVTAKADSSEGVVVALRTDCEPEVETHN